MARIWRVVFTLAVILAIAGLLLAGTGWITGASIERVQDVYDGQMHTLWSTYNRIAATVSSFFGGITGL